MTSYEIKMLRKDRTAAERYHVAEATRRRRGILRDRILFLLHKKFLHRFNKGVILHFTLLLYDVHCEENKKYDHRWKRSKGDYEYEDEKVYCGSS